MDICGFSGNTTQELCSRWQQLGAFYPFSRNHNEINAIVSISIKLHFVLCDPQAQDPTVWDNKTIGIIRRSLLLRYSLLPYLYTLFYLAHTNGDTVARPLFMQYVTIISCDPSIVTTQSCDPSIVYLYHVIYCVT